MLLRTVVCVAVLAAAVPTSYAATATESLNQFRATLRDARERSDWAASATAARRIKELLNDSPQSRLEAARAEVRAGQADAALDELTAYVAMGQASEVLEKLPDFEPLRQLPGFTAVRRSLEANRSPVEHAAVAFQITDAALLPEDIDFDRRSRRFFLTSVLQHRIVTVTPAGSLAEFAKSPDGWPVFALKVDAKRQVVWATEVAVEGWESVKKSDQGRSAVLCYDLGTGKLVRRIEGPRPSALGDMTLTVDGGVIVSDGQHGGLYRLAPGKDPLERLDNGDFISPQTALMAPDAAHLYVPDYVRGLGVLDLGTRQVKWIPMTGRYALTGIDGLYRLGQHLIAVQNGTSPERVVAFSLDAPGTMPVAEEVIERATATLGDPTHGVVVDGVFYYIANSGWDGLGDEGRVASGAKMTPAVVMKWNIPRS